MLFNRPPCLRPSLNHSHTLHEPLSVGCSHTVLMFCIKGWIARLTCKRALGQQWAGTPCWNPVLPTLCVLVYTKYPPSTVQTEEYTYFNLIIFLLIAPETNEYSYSVDQAPGLLCVNLCNFIKHNLICNLNILSTEIINNKLKKSGFYKAILWPLFKKGPPQIMQDPP